MTGYRGDKIKLFTIQALVGMLKSKFYHGERRYNLNQEQADGVLVSPMKSVETMSNSEKTLTEVKSPLNVYKSQMQRCTGLEWEKYMYMKMRID